MLCAESRRDLGKPTSGIKWVHDTTIQLYTTSYGTFSLGISTKQHVVCVFFAGKTTVPIFPWGTRRWTMVGMTGWFVDLNWDVRWCNHRQWFLIWIYQTMNLVFSTIWFQHRLNNDISNVSYVQMMFFSITFQVIPKWPCSVVDAFWGPENERSGGTTLSSMDQTWTAFLGPRLWHVHWRSWWMMDHQWFGFELGGYILLSLMTWRNMLKGILPYPMSYDQWSIWWGSLVNEFAWFDLWFPLKPMADFAAIRVFPEPVYFFIQGTGKFDGKNHGFRFHFSLQHSQWTYKFP